ncbi:MAG: transglutaminase family protein [Pseudomonadota bacterium]
MTTLRIHHRTTYSYDGPVTFGAHRLRIRPRDGHDMRILDSALTVTPKASVHWEYDTFGNSVAQLTFHDKADRLVIASDLLLRRYGLDDPEARIERTAGPWPFTYEPEEAFDLSPLLHIHSPQDQPVLRKWLAEQLPELPDGSFQVLDLLSGRIHDCFAYRRREESGVQSPAETLAAGSGTCRDFAYFFMEAARSLGFAARFVTGYLYDPAEAEEQNSASLSGGGATHAWADVFVPGAGWIEFDPTNQIIAGRNLVRVASTRTPQQAMPVSGSYHDSGSRFLSMEVEVSVVRSEE